MTEDEAKAWASCNLSSGQIDALCRFAELLATASLRHNLVSASSLEQLWARHIVDSAQLATLVDGEGTWLDIGSGAGLPGLVVAIVSAWQVSLVEPRRLRVEFLNDCIARLDMGDRVTVVHSKAETARLASPASVLSARAVASLPRLFAMAGHLADRRTRWVLPKGRTAQSEVAEARRSWHGSFHVEQSIVDPTSGIIVAEGIAPR